jgi:hypothetical protein
MESLIWLAPVVGSLLFPLAQRIAGVKSQESCGAIL